MTTEEKKTRADKLTSDICLVADLTNRIRENIDAMREAVYQEAAADEAERKMEKITGRGITIYKIGRRSYVEIPELMSLIAEEKRNYMDGTRPGYVEPKLKRRISAMSSLNHLQVQILRNELDKCRTPEEIRDVSLRYREREEKL